MISSGTGFEPVNAYIDNVIMNNEVLFATNFCNSVAKIVNLSVFLAVSERTTSRSLLFLPLKNNRRGDNNFRQ